MNIDFSKILKSTKSDNIEPRDIFMALPGKDKIEQGTVPCVD